MKKGVNIKEEKYFFEQKQNEINDELQKKGSFNQKAKVERGVLNEVSDAHSNNLNDLINKTFKQKYSKFCEHEKKIKESESKMLELTKKTNVIDNEFKKPIFPQKVINYDDEYQKIMAMVAGSIGGEKEKVQKSTRLRKINIRPEASKLNLIKANEVKNNENVKSDLKKQNEKTEERKKGILGIRRFYKQKMETILSKMPKLN